VPVRPALVLLTIAYAVLLAIALGLTDRLNRRWLGTAGALTYPFYLLHQRVGYCLIRTTYQHTALPAAVVIAGVVVVLLVLAGLVHRLVERPLAPVLRARILGRRRQPKTAEDSRRQPKTSRKAW
jgi:peptidoglycan/LPS O-acetylase OafA/YrhL